VIGALDDDEILVAARDEDQAIRFRQTRQFVAADRQLLWGAAEGRPLFSDGLIETQRRSAAAVAEEHDLVDARLLPQVLDALFDVERNDFPR
jgi:hypothetical protein